jgi:dTMP kinase
MGDAPDGRPAVWPYCPLIVLEGIDGAGTTTQARRLAEHLRDWPSVRSPRTGVLTDAELHRMVELREGRSRRVLLTRQPSDGPIGLLLREMLSGAHRVPGRVSSDPSEAPTTATLAALFAADRYDHLQRQVDPALARDEIVVSDRWYHSSFAYQGSVVGMDWVADLNYLVRVPSLTIFLRCDPEVAVRRRIAAGLVHEMFDDLLTQRRVAWGYERALALMRGRALSHGFSTDNVEVVDGELPEDEVHLAVAALAERLILSRSRDREAAR